MGNRAADKSIYPTQLDVAVGGSDAWTSHGGEPVVGLG